MRKLVGLLALFLVVWGPGSICNADEVGLYFDANGTVSCSSSILIPLDVYIVAKNLTYPDAIGGWEMVIDSDDSIVLSGVEFNGDVVNVGTFPGIMAGLAEPLVSSGGGVVLATLSVIAVDEGQLYIHGFSPPSIRGSIKPIYSVYGTEELVEMDVHSPEGISGQAEVVVDCGAPLAQTTAMLSEYQIPGSSEFFVAEGVITSVLESSPGEKSFSMVELWLYNSDVAFVGEVEEVDYRCLSLNRGGPASLALIQFHVLDAISGVAGNRIVIETIVDRPENCVAYTGAPLFREFLQGDKFLVAADGIGPGRFRASPNSIWRYQNGQLGSASGEKSAGTFDDLIQRVKGNGNLDNQSKMSDLVALGEVVRSWVEGGLRYAEVRVIKVELGGCESPIVIVAQQANGREEDIGLVIPGPLRDGGVYLLFLEHEGAFYSPVYGRRSIFVLRDDDLYTVLDEKWGSLGMAEAMLGGLK